MLGLLVYCRDQVLGFGQDTLFFAGGFSTLGAGGTSIGVQRGSTARSPAIVFNQPFEFVLL